MNITRFAQSSGFKILAFAKLTQCEYSLILYFLNLSASGMGEVVSTEAELASLAGFFDNEIRDTLASLAGRNMIQVLYSKRSKKDHEHNSLRIKFEFNTSKWKLNLDNDTNEKDAIVYPFRRDGRSMFKVFDGEKNQKSNKKTETWERVIRYFTQGRTLTDLEIEENKSAAKILIETHPVDQVLLFLRHFGLRIPSLSLLASSWQHFQEQFASETQKIDMLGARQKHIELDERLRNNAKNWLEKSSDLEFNEEEVGVLNILIKHRHPRRQLFWAYQLRSRYERLQDFFEENASIMIPIASNGTIIKKKK